MQKIYAIVITYNGLCWIDRCFQSLLHSTQPVEVLAIDNASTDGTPEKIKQRFPEVTVIEIGQNLGFGKANNIGFKIAVENDAEFVFLLNQDAWVKSQTIGNLVAIARKKPEYGILSPIHLNGSGNAIDRNFQNYLGAEFVPNLISDMYLDNLKDVYPSKYANAAAWLISRKCLDTIGGFDPLFKHYGEDDDYIARMMQSGLKLGIVPHSVIFHDRSQQEKRSDAFLRNETYTRALLTAKSGHEISRFYLWRKIAADYFSLFFVYRGKNKALARDIKIDRLALKLRRQIKPGYYKSF